MPKHTMKHVIWLEYENAEEAADGVPKLHVVDDGKGIWLDTSGDATATYALKLVAQVLKNNRFPLQAPSKRTSGDTDQ